ncbi:hypothetical protein FG386_000161 [Cryptosporidium ryanae]|uniref:uncharacterized protein n=1 Tax=Cryptosporidium ryanae TaxID=515981 RepID=UPI003519F564|nr:hypothetical protein FG386_000161 [Cryptosporidium ryanae]
MNLSFTTFLLIYSIFIYSIGNFEYEVTKNQVKPIFNSCFLKLTAAGGGSPELPRKRGSENTEVSSSMMSAMKMLSLDEEGDSYELESSLIKVCQSLRECIEPHDSDEISVSGLKEMIRSEIVSETGFDKEPVTDKDFLKKLKSMKKKYYKKWTISQETGFKLESLLCELEKKQSTSKYLDKDDIRALQEQIFKTNQEIEALGLIKSALEKRYKMLLDIEEEITTKRGRSHCRTGDTSRHSSVSLTRREQRRQCEYSSDDSDSSPSHIHGQKTGVYGVKHVHVRGLTGKKKRHRRKKSTV